MIQSQSAGPSAQAFRFQMAAFKSPASDFVPMESIIVVGATFAPTENIMVVVATFVRMENITAAAAIFVQTGSIVGRAIFVLMESTTMVAI